MALTLESTVTKVLKDFDDHGRILGIFEACVVAFAKGAGVMLEVIGLTMEGDDICGCILVPSPPFVTRAQRLRIHITVHTRGTWSVDLETDEKDEDIAELDYAFHSQYAQSLMSLCMRGFLDAIVVLNW